MNKLKIETLSPFDDDFPLKVLESAFSMRIEESKVITNRLVSNVMKVNKNMVPTVKEGEEKIRLVIDESDDFLNDYKSGVIKLSKEKGQLVAQLKNNGRYGKKLPIKEEKYLDGANSLEVMNACQLQNIAESLQEITDQILAIDENIKEVIKGQQNDRLGLYYSGVALFIESNSIENDVLKSQLISQSLKTLTDANYQLVLSIQSDINYLARKEYERQKKQKFNLMNQKITNINNSFLAIHRAILVKVGIYCQQGEINAMANVFNEYALFIKNTIVPNSKLLSQCDIGDTGKIDGTWGIRTKLLTNVTDVVKQLTNTNKVLCLDYKGEIDK